MNNQQALQGNFKISGHEFITTLPAAQLLKITTDPRLTENQKARESHAGLEEIFNLRQQVQRLFTGAKQKNVAAYAKYIASLDAGSFGVTPQIILYTSRDLDSEGNVLYLPWDEELVAIDGETQLAARFEALKFSPSTAKQLVDVRICYNRPIEWAKQAFHDLNSLAVRVNSPTALAMDTRDALTSVTRNIAESPFFKGRVSSDRQLGKKDTSILTFSGLRAAVVGFYEGAAGFQHGNKPVDVRDPRDLALLELAAKDWFNLLAEKIGPAMEKRTETVAAAPSVLASLGVLGHRASKMEDPAERMEVMKELVAALDDIDWRRGPNWAGLAGQMRAAKLSKRTGKTIPATFSTGGSGVKDAAAQALAAISDPKSPAFYKIRGHVPGMLKAA